MSATWLDRLQSVEQARSVPAALIRKRPELQEVFQVGFARVEQDVTALDQQLSENTRRRPAQGRWVLSTARPPWLPLWRNHRCHAEITLAVGLCLRVASQANQEIVVAFVLVPLFIAVLYAVVHRIRERVEGIGKDKVASEAG